MEIKSKQSKAKNSILSTPLYYQTAIKVVPVLSYHYFAQNGSLLPTSFFPTGEPLCDFAIGSPEKTRKLYINSKAHVIRIKHKNTKV
jgi:hypothetical protein